MDNKSFVGLHSNMMKELKIHQAYRQDSQSSSSNFHLSTKYKSNAIASSRLTNSSDNRQSCSHSTETCFDVYKAVLNNLKENKKYMADVRQLMGKRKKHTFGSADQLDNKIESLLGRSRALMADTETQISEALNLLSINASSRIKTLINNMKCCLSGKIGKAAQELRQIDQLYLTAKNIAIDDHHDKNSEFSFIHSQSTNDRAQVLYDESGNSLIMAEIEQAEASNELKAIFRSIDSLSKLLQDMSAFVVTQGTLIDRIDINITSTLESVQRTNTELIISRDMLKNDLTSKCTKWLVIINALVFILLLIKHLF